MRASDYFKDRASDIAIALTAGIIIITLLWLIGVSKIFVVFVGVIFFAVFFISMLLDFIKRKQYYNMLLETLDNLEEKSLLPEIIKQAPFLDAKIVYEIISRTDKYMNDRLSAYDKEAREYREYVEMWVHEIKTPVTSARLMIENDKNITTLRIGDEVRKAGGLSTMDSDHIWLSTT